MDQTSVFAPIFKSSEQDDGTLLIYGKATGSDLDLDQQRCDPDWLGRAMPEWFKIGNIREQHDAKRAVGKATEHEVKADGHYIKAHIVDPVAVAKTKAGVFTGLSIGIMKPRLEKTADGEWIRDGLIGEVSLCDRPCLPTATFTMCKTATPGMEVNASDFDEDRGLVKCEELTLADEPAVEKTVTVPSPLNMPGARKAVTTVAESQAVTGELLEKATDTGRLDAPNHSQTCATCAEPGHVWCAPEGFDKNAAMELVTQTIEKAAGDGLGQDESGDISGAEQAIAAIAALIISEAQDLANMPSQGCDIHLLMSAVDALRIFACREKLEQGAVDPDSMVCLAADPEVTKKSKYDAEQMAAMLKDGSAMANPNGDPSYPIKDAEDLANAIKAVGRGSGDRDAIRAHIVKRAKALDKADMIPDDWTKAVASDLEKGRTVTFELDGKSYTATLNDNPTPDETVKTVVADEAEPVEVEKAVTPETPVDAEQADTEKSTAPDLVKTLTGALKDEDSELRELFKSLLRDGTTAKALEATQVTLGDISARLEQVEKMAAPGGPALRRTDAEVKKSRESDLLLQAEIEDRKAESTYVPELKKGYADKARDLRAEAKALAA